jgi:chemotaxis signal transduction protein
VKREEIRLRVLERCWSVIGVLGGDRSCPLLLTRGHCRECEVVEQAAHQLLSRPGLSPDARQREESDEIAEAANADTFSVITFDVGGHNLALEAKRIVEVSEARAVCRVPHRTSPAFLGLVNVQGVLEPCFDLVVGDENRRCAFLAQNVALREADLARVGDPPATVSGALDTHVRGILRLADRPWSWLDVDRLMSTLEKAIG